MKCNVTIDETRTRTVTIDAESTEDAIEKAVRGYKNGEISMSEHGVNVHAEFADFDNYYYGYTAETDWSY